MRRIVITGVGSISPLGLNSIEGFDNLVKGGHGFREIERFSPKERGCKTIFAAQVDENFDPLNHSPFKELPLQEQKKLIKKFDKHQIFSLVAAAEAIKMANLENIQDEGLLNRIGVNFATGVGGLENMEECTLVSQAGKKQSPFGNLKFLPNIAAGYISDFWDFRGPNNAHCSACAAGAHSIVDGFNAILTGEADVIIAGGSEAAITPVGISTFNAQSALSTKNDVPEAACRPFTKDKDGFVMGEGAACIVLEELDHALNRGASIYAELSGFCRTSDGRKNAAIAAPHPEGLGAKRAILGAIKMSGKTVNDVDFISAHATSTMADDVEIKAIRDALGQHAQKVLVSGIKSSTGHLLGASGALASVFSILSMVKSVVPYTRNLVANNLSDTCSGVSHVMNEPLNRTINFMLTNAFGFGGTNCCIAFSRYDDA